MTAVRKIQIFIDESYQNSDFSAETVYEKFAYSPRHLNRLFKEFTGKTVSEYISAMKITNSAEGIKNNSVLNIAVDSGYDTCEGYTKAFKKQFGVTPNDYKKFKPMIPLFVNYPVNHQIRISPDRRCEVAVILHRKSEMSITQCAVICFLHCSEGHRAYNVFT